MVAPRLWKRSARPWRIPSLAVGVALAWQALVVTVIFTGVGALFSSPATAFPDRRPFARSRPIPYRVAPGRRSVLSRYAHDPLDLRGTDRYIDAPHIRYLRILPPALSYALGGGGPFLVDRAYRALELASLSLGVLCVGACCLDRLCASVYAATAGGLERASRAAGSLRPSRALEFAALSI